MDTAAYGLGGVIVAALLALIGVRWSRQPQQELADLSMLRQLYEETRQDREDLKTEIRRLRAEVGRLEAQVAGLQAAVHRMRNEPVGEEWWREGC